MVTKEVGKNLRGRNALDVLKDNAERKKFFDQFDKTSIRINKQTMRIGNLKNPDQSENLLFFARRKGYIAQILRRRNLISLNKDHSITNSKKLHQGDDFVSQKNMVKDSLSNNCKDNDEIRSKGMIANKLGTCSGNESVYVDNDVAIGRGQSNLKVKRIYADISKVFDRPPKYIISNESNKDIILSKDSIKHVENFFSKACIDFMMRRFRNDGVSYPVNDSNSYIGNTIDISNTMNFLGFGVKNKNCDEENTNIDIKTKYIYMEKDIDLIEKYGWNFDYRKSTGDKNSIGTDQLDEASCILGEGAYGKVYKMYNTTKDERRAMKRIRWLDNRSQINEGGFPSYLLREISILREINHKNIIELKEVYFGEERIYLSFPYMDGGNLLDFLKTKFVNYGKVMPMRLIRSVMRQLLSAIEYLHSMHILHRDVKSQNILCYIVNDKNVRSDSESKLDDAFVSNADKSASIESKPTDNYDLFIKLADFGLSKIVGFPENKLSPDVVTVHYRCIELFLGLEIYSSAIDIWACGCVMLELLLNKNPFYAKSEVGVLFQGIFNRFGTPNEQDWPHVNNLQYMTKTFPKIPRPNDPFEDISNFRSDVTVCCKDFLSRMFVYNPERRITAKEALKHPWFSET